MLAAVICVTPGLCLLQHIMTPSRSPLHLSSPSGEGIAFELHRCFSSVTLPYAAGTSSTAASSEWCAGLMQLPVCSS